MKSKQVLDEVSGAGISVSDKTIRRRLREKGFKSCVQRCKPLLTKKAAKHRLAFARKYRHMPIDFWKKVIFSDESMFQLISNKRRTRVWRKPNEEFERRMTKGVVKHSPHVMVWSCFSWNGTGPLVFIRGNMTADKYIDIINDNLMVAAIGMGISDNFIFQQDNDPKHTAKITKQYFEEMGLNVLEWPSYSPDINPIEHLWDELDRCIPPSKRATMKEFENELKSKWESLRKEILENLIHSLPNRLKAVIKAKGYHTKY